MTSSIEQVVRNVAILQERIDELRNDLSTLKIELSKIHRPTGDETDCWCENCGTDWPCTTYQILFPKGN